MSDVLKDAADGHQVVSHTGWVNARKALLAKEKAFTRLRDELTRERAALPWELVDRSYVFEGASGPRALGDLFEGRSQLIAYHFMFHPEWPVGCPHCSRVADSFNGIIAHLNHRDSTMVAISRAPYPKLAAYHVRMGWTFPWLSSFGNDFNRDYGVSFTPDEIATIVLSR